MDACGHIDINNLAMLPRLKRGDSFSLACVYKEDGAPSSVASVTIAAQLRDSNGVLVQDLAVSKADQVAHPGVFALTAGPTDSWPVDLLIGDIKFTDGVGGRRTQTFGLEVVEGVTE